LKFRPEIVDYHRFIHLCDEMKLEQLLASPDFTEKYVLQKLLMHYLWCTREEMRTDGEREITPDLLEKITTGYHAYVNEQKPLEYIVGSVEFYKRTFVVNENTLIPRPETEYMIEAICDYTQEKKFTDGILMDIGTGCGVLGSSVLLENPDNFRTAFFTDISQEALAVAKINSDRLLGQAKQEIFFVWTDLLAFVDSYESIRNTKPIVLVANLPYIPEATFDENAPDNVQKWEPKMAFVGGDDGLLYYRKMLDQMPANMQSTTVCFFEMMTRQIEILDKEYGENRLFEEVKTFHFNIRIVKATKKS